MATSFISAVTKATRKQVIRLVESPYGSKYLQVDDAFKNRPDLRLESVKAFFRTYQKQKAKLAFTIKEADTFIHAASNAAVSTDEFFDSIFRRSQKDEKVEKQMLFIFSYLRGDALPPAAS